MKKSYFLFFLLLLSVVGSVNATNYNIDIQSNEGTSAYYVELVDTYSDSLIFDSLNVTEWESYAPVVVGYSNNKVYFNSEYDLARFCSFMNYNSKILPFSGRFIVYTNGIETPVTSAYAGTDLVVAEIENPSTAYILTHVSSWTMSYASAKVYFNSELISTASGGAGYDSDYVSRVIPTGYETYISHNDYGSGIVSVVCFGYVTFTNGTPTILYEPPARYDLTLNSNVNSFELFDGDISLGIYDNGDTIPLTVGTHTLTFVKDGYSDVTQTIEITDSDTSLDFSMITTHLPVELTLTNSEGGLASVSMYIDDELVNTVSNGQTVQLPRGSHLFKFVKSGYWNETRTLNIDESFDSLDIRFYPLSVMYSIQVPTDINTFKNSEVPVIVTISPKAMSSSTKIYLSGKEVLDVRDSSNTQIPYVNGGYLIGDISVPTDITIKFMSGETLGTNALQMRVMGYGTLGQSYVTDTSFTYEVVQLPLTLTVPSKWNIGSNNLRVSETEGENRLVMIQVEDAENNIVYSDSYAFSGYESHDFEITFEKTGDYRLRILSGDLINSYLNIEVVNPILFSQTTITGKPGTASSLSVNIQNLFTSPQYYKVEISGDGLSEPSITEFSVSPGVTKSQTLLVPVGENLTFDSYLLTATVYLKDSNGIYENILEESIILNIDLTGLSVGGVDLSGLDITALIPSGISFGSISPDTIFDMAKNNPLLVGLVALFMVIGGSTLIPGGRKK